MPRSDKGLAWVQQHYTIACPRHGQSIEALPTSLVRRAAWCPTCQRIWFVRRNERTWRVLWYYEKTRTSTEQEKG